LGSSESEADRFNDQHPEIPIRSPDSDGWSDARSRRSQSITGRLVDGDERIRTVVLSLKKIVEIPESMSLLRDIVTGVVHNYDFPTKLLNICTDRHSMNVSAFPDRPLVAGYVWVPCCVQLPNSLLICFDKNIAGIVNPMLEMRACCARGGPFFAYLRTEHCSCARIRSDCPVRWSRGLQK
jgi:hypothetical protein